MQVKIVTYHFKPVILIKARKKDNNECHQYMKKWLDFPGGPVLKTSPSNARGNGLIPGWGAKIPYASWLKNPKQIIKQKYNTFNKDFKVIQVKNSFKIWRNEKLCITDESILGHPSESKLAGLNEIM